MTIKQAILQMTKTSFPRSELKLTYVIYIMNYNNYLNPQGVLVYPETHEKWLLQQNSFILNKMKKFVKNLVSLDISGSPVSLNFKGDSSYKTGCGTLLTILSYGIMLAYGIA